MNSTSTTSKIHAENFIKEYANSTSITNRKNQAEIDSLVKTLRKEWKDEKRKMLYLSSLGEKLDEELLENIMHKEIHTLDGMQAYEKKDKLKNYIQIILDAMCGILTEQEFEEEMRKDPTTMTKVLTEFENMLKIKSQQLSNRIDETIKLKINTELLILEIDRRREMQKVNMMGMIPQEYFDQDENKVSQILNEALLPQKLEPDELMHPILIIGRVYRNKETRIQICLKNTEDSEIPSILEKILLLFNVSDLTLDNKTYVFKVPPSVPFESIFFLKAAYLAQRGVVAIVFGEYGFNQTIISNRTKLNKIYSNDGTDVAEGYNSAAATSSPKTYGNENYYSPIGWRMHARDLGLIPEQFETKYKNWPVAYHGTDVQNICSILGTGLGNSRENPLHITQDQKNLNSVYAPI